MPAYMNDLTLCQVEKTKRLNKFRKMMLNGTKLDIEIAVENLNHIKAVEAKLIAEIDWAGATITVRHNAATLLASKRAA